MKARHKANTSLRGYDILLIFKYFYSFIYNIEYFIFIVNINLAYIRIFIK
nr:hypothetical protein SRSACTRX_SRSACTRX_CDS_0002 [Microvirus sp.]